MADISPNLSDTVWSAMVFLNRMDGVPYDKMTPEELNHYNIADNVVAKYSEQYSRHFAPIPAPQPTVPVPPVVKTDKIPEKPKPLPKASKEKKSFVPDACWCLRGKTTARNILNVLNDLYMGKPLNIWYEEARNSSNEFDRKRKSHMLDMLEKLDNGFIKQLVDYHRVPTNEKYNMLLHDINKSNYYSVQKMFLLDLVKSKREQELAQSFDRVRETQIKLCEQQRLF